MTDFDFPPYVGALYVDDVAKASAFVCHAPQMLITCAHCLDGNPTKLAWRRFDNNQLTKLVNWKVPVKDSDMDVAIIVNDTPLIPRVAVAELPRPAQNRGLDVYFSGLGELIEGGSPALIPDSGSGTLIGFNLPFPTSSRIKMESKHVTPGYSGTPVLYYSGIGWTVVGMISGRYNSSSWNRDTIWVVRAEAIRHAIRAAQPVLINASLNSDPVAELELEFDVEQLRAYLKVTLGGTD